MLPGQCVKLLCATISKSPSQERDAERAGHWLWQLPPLERGTLVTWGLLDKQRGTVVRISPATLRQTPAWPKDAAEPPFSALKAMNRAETVANRLLPPGNRFTWNMDSVLLKNWAEDRYYYEIVFTAEPWNAISPNLSPSLRLFVLMDGTVAEPEIWDSGDLIRSIRGGALDVEGSKSPEGKPWDPWEWTDDGEPWSALPWRSKLPLLSAMVTAPKLLYDLEKLTVYSNGVWAEYTVTNLSNRRRFFPPIELAVPVRNAGLWDSAGEKWWARRPYDTSDTGKSTRGVAIEARQTVSYRAMVSYPTEQPLKPFGRVERTQPVRATALEYFINAWPPAFPRPEIGTESDGRVFAFGYGRVPVVWIDRSSPRDWPVCSTLIEPRVVR